MDISNIRQMAKLLKSYCNIDRKRKQLVRIMPGSIVGSKCKHAIKIILYILHFTVYFVG